MKHIVKKMSALVLAVLLVIGILAVPTEVQAAAVSLSKTKVTLKVGQQEGLYMSEPGVYYPVQKVSSSNSDVAAACAYNDMVLIAAKKAGTATITAESMGQKCTCKVTVTGKFALANTKGKNASDVAVLEKLIKEYFGTGPLSADLNKKRFYRWNEKGRLTYLNLEAEIAGSLSLKLSELTKLKCSSNKLTSLDVSKCTKLNNLTCSYSKKLTNLNVSGCTDLKTLDCSSNKLASLNVSKCTNLKNLYCSDNKLTGLDVSGCTNLKKLECSRNKLTDLDVSNCKKLEVLQCEGNKLKSLDVSNCKKLKELLCRNNKLKSLDVSNCKNLKDFWYDNNVTVTGWEEEE